MLGIKRIAAMCILQNDRQYLLLKRNKAPNKGMYVPVGGKLDPHEGPRQAVIRETFEETGITIENPIFCGTLIETSPIKYNWMCYVYLSYIDYIEPPFCDEGTLAWIHHDELLSVPTPPTDWQIYKYVLEKRPFAFNAHYNEKLEMLWMMEEFEGIKV